MRNLPTVVGVADFRFAHSLPIDHRCEVYWGYDYDQGKG